MAAISHIAAATPPGPATVVDLAALCNEPVHELYGLAATGSTNELSQEGRCIVEVAPGLHEIQTDTETAQGRQWLYRPRRDLAVLISALTRTPVLQYSMTGDAMVIAQLRLNGYAIFGEQPDDDTASAAITYLPPGSRLPVTLPRVGPWCTIAVFGRLAAIQRQSGLGPAIAQALDSQSSTLQNCRQIVRKPWGISQSATELLRDALSFRFSGAAARAYVEARGQQLLCEVLAGLREPRRRRPLPARTRELVLRARDLLISNPARHHTLHSLSRTLGLNRTLLAEGFHAEFGETVFAFLQSERLRRAWSLLEHSGERVGSIAAQVGYRDAASFARAFKARYGITPRHVGRATARPQTPS